MSELTDLEICKRIGEIESLNGDFGTHLNGAHGRRYIDGSFKYYNPLTDDTLCFQLMVKYEVNVDSYLGVTSISSDYTNKPNIAQVSYMDYTINKAIWLTIIEAHKVKS